MKYRYHILAAMAAFVITSCADNDKNSFYVDELVIDTENCFAEGSYVQGVSTSAEARVRVPYEGAAGGTAVFSAPRENGLSINEQTFDLADGQGEVLLAVTGVPLRCETTFLQLNVLYNGKKYLSSVEITVLEDLDPSGKIEFNCQLSKVGSLTEDLVVPFTVSPTMASVVESSPEIDGLRVVIASDPETGEGTVTLKPAPNFVGGTVELTASFGAREKQKSTISVSAFAAGDGTSGSPYIVSTPAELSKLEYGLTSYFKLGSDITLDASWSPVGTKAAPFNGGLDGDSHKVKLAIDRPSEDNIAMFAFAGGDAVIKNLVLEGYVNGRDYVSSTVSESAAILEGVNADAVKVTGRNYVAAKVASGAGRDEKVIVFNEVPASVNIPMGETSVSDLLGLVTDGADVVFNPGSTGTEWSYDGETGQFTVNKTASFSSGDVTFTVSLGDNVVSTPRTINVMSKNMFEGGTGVEGDPYIVIDADQFTTTLHVYPGSCVKLTSDIELANWETIPELSGSVDGDGHTVTGLSSSFASAVTGTVKNIKFIGIDVTAAKAVFGAVACNLSGTIRNVAVTGNLTAPQAASSGDTGLSPLVGQASGTAVIDNCFVDVQSVISGGNFAYGGLVGVIKATGNITMSNSTVAGRISSSINATKVGGVLGRKTNTNQTSKDIITGCLVSAEIAISGTGSNMIGGVFGALQGSTVSGDYVGGLTIEKTAFTGSVSGGNAVGGIGGVCCSVRDCYVSGSVQAISVTSSSTAAAAGVSAAAKGDVTRCVVSSARVTGGPKGSSYTAAVINVKNGNAPKTSSCYVLNTVVQTGGFAVYGTANADVTASGNYRWNITYSEDGSAYMPLATDTYGQDGEEKQLSQSDLEALGYDFTSVWNWDAGTSSPVLRKVGCDESVIIK
ncbi:MAG: hypothetical protein ACI3ZT_10240 [Candidatus Cryptobacteroides sp.]